ncbi:MAG: DUF1801 domain-containing protein [Acidobacteriota bacterium]|nr:DUF1801 domain-containing protein [Acidobacteriota bacterium]
MKTAKKGSAQTADGAAAVEAYLARVPEPARTTLRTLRARIRAAAPRAAAECISYGMPAFRYKGSLVAYAAFKNHCSFFPMQASLIDAMQDELAGYRTSKGTLQFPIDQPLPAVLVRKMVKARVTENERKEHAKSR